MYVIVCMYMWNVCVCTLLSQICGSIGAMSCSNSCGKTHVFLISLTWMEWTCAKQSGFQHVSSLHSDFPMEVEEAKSKRRLAIKQLRQKVGPRPADQTLHGLLSRCDGDVNRAATAFWNGLPYAWRPWRSPRGPKWHGVVVSQRPNASPTYAWNDNV